MNEAAKAPITDYDEDAIDITDTPSDIWRVGFHISWSSVFESWLDTRFFFTVKPGQTGREAYHVACGDPFRPSLDRVVIINR